MVEVLTSKGNGSFQVIEMKLKNYRQKVRCMDLVKNSERIEKCTSIKVQIPGKIYLFCFQNTERLLIYMKASPGLHVHDSSCTFSVLPIITYLLLGARFQTIQRFPLRLENSKTILAKRHMNHQIFLPRMLYYKINHFLTL